MPEYLQQWEVLGASAGGLILVAYNLRHKIAAFFRGRFAPDGSPDKHIRWDQAIKHYDALRTYLLQGGEKEAVELMRGPIWSSLENAVSKREGDERPS